jgi:hypothetical protein
LDISIPGEPPIDHSSMAIQAQEGRGDPKEQDDQANNAQHHRRFRLACGSEQAQSENGSNSRRDPKTGFLGEESGQFMRASWSDNDNHAHRRNPSAQN